MKCSQTVRPLESIIMFVYLWVGAPAGEGTFCVELCGCPPGAPDSLEKNTQIYSYKYPKINYSN